MTEETALTKAFGPNRCCSNASWQDGCDLSHLVFAATSTETLKSLEYVWLGWCGGAQASTLDPEPTKTKETKVLSYIVNSKNQSTDQRFNSRLA
jgi:hypothetical protein